MSNCGRPRYLAESLSERRIGAEMAIAHELGRCRQTEERRELRNRRSAQRRMYVESQWEGHRVVGLYIGARNVQRYFPQNLEAIDLQLEHLHIVCALKADFWKEQPEIKD